MPEQLKLSPEEIEVVDRLGVEWQKTIEELDGNMERAKEIFDKVVEMYRTGKGRAYHNLFHVDRMLSVVNRFIHLADNPAIVRAAVFGHDIVYEPGNRTNEAESAGLFSAYLAMMDIDSEKIEGIKRLIMITENHKTTDDDRDGRLMIDSDYEILGSATERYIKYSRGGIYVENVESGKYSVKEYKSGRGSFLNGWLKDIENNRLYLNSEIGEALNDQARENILAEIEWLETLSY